MDTREQSRRNRCTRSTKCISQVILDLHYEVYAELNGLADRDLVTRRMYMQNCIIRNVLHL